jgi:hypothetical protein
MPVCNLKYEQGPIRPPSEATSLLIRLTRNCPWNQCLFCPVYKGKTYSRRSSEEIKNDIRAMFEVTEVIRNTSMQLGFNGNVNRQTIAHIHNENPEAFQIAYWLFNGAKNVFFQDADSLLLPVDQFLEVLQFLKITFPSIERITTYARSRSLLRFSEAELEKLKNSGLNRIHVGLESGNDAVLDFMKKGVKGQQHIEAGKRVKAAGLSLCYYVILGLGGRNLWREHALDTAEVINQVDPDFIRVRTLAIHPASPLYRLFTVGDFTPLSDDEIISEEILFINSMTGINSVFVSDHILNLLEEVQGKIPEDQGTMIAVLKKYLELPEEKRNLFRIGRRNGYFRALDDLSNPLLCKPVTDYYRQLQDNNVTVDEQIQQLMLRFI